jgi:hypothetical protein
MQRKSWILVKSSDGQPISIVPVDTPQQTEEARRILAAVGKASARIFVGDYWQGTAVGTGRVLAASYKVCGCGKRYTVEQWRALALVGHGQGLEYRNCSCRSTLAVEVAP